MTFVNYGILKMMVNVRRLYINPNNPFTNITPAQMEFRKLLNVSFIFEKGISISTRDHIKATPINK